MSDFLYEKTYVPRDEEEDRLSRERVDKKIFWILLAVIAILPLVVGGHVTNFISPVISNSLLLTTGAKGDIFTYYKFIFMVAATIAVVSLFLYKLLFLNYSLPKRSILWCFFIFAFGIVLATVLAPYKSIALFGQPDRYDGAISYICYLLLMFVAIHIQYPKRAVSYILYSLYLFVFVNFTLSLMNFLGHDALTFRSVQRLMTAFLPQGASLSKDSQLLGTLNQWNYMSGMFGVMTVMYWTGAIIEKNIWARAAHLAVALISFAIVLMSLSTSGFLTIVLLIPFLVFIGLKTSDKKISLLVLIVFLLLAVPIFHVLASKNPRVWSESIGFFVKQNPYEENKQGATLKVQPVHFDISFSPKVYAAENQQFALPHLPKPGLAPGTGRLYIWKKTLDITKDRFIVGYGLDTLPYHFPQNDIEKRAGLGTNAVIVDKPHNVYIGVLYGTGSIGFIGFIGLAFITIRKIGQVLWQFRKTQSTVVVLGMAWLAYLIQSLFNDTVPGTAAPMWTLVGIMLALIYKKEKTTESQ